MTRKQSELFEFTQLRDTGFMVDQYDRIPPSRDGASPELQRGRLLRRLVTLQR